jgi:hypothetical protein
MKTTIKMAREADGLGFVHDAGDAPSKWQFTPKELDRLIKLVRADEREACAKVCEELGMATNGMYERNHECAEAIRARGNT